MSDNDMIRRGDALKARTLWMQIDGEGRIDSICTAPFPGHDAYISYLAIEAIPAVTTPDPRDEVIAALVAAAEAYVSRNEEYHTIPRDRGGSHGPLGKAFIAVGDAYIAMCAALAAAKAVQP